MSGLNGLFGERGQVNDVVLAGARSPGAASIRPTRPLLLIYEVLFRVAADCKRIPRLSRVLNRGGFIVGGIVGSFLQADISCGY